MARLQGPTPVCVVTRSAVAGLLVLGLVGCGKKHEVRDPADVAATEHAGRIEPATETERRILGALDALPNGVPRAVGDVTVTATAPYLAASGNTCRQLSWKTASRVACRDADGWYFVPDVFRVGE